MTSTIVSALGAALQFLGRDSRRRFAAVAMIGLVGGAGGCSTTNESFETDSGALRATPPSDAGGPEAGSAVSTTEAVAETAPSDSDSGVSAAESSAAEGESHWVSDGGKAQTISEPSTSQNGSALPTTTTSTTASSPETEPPPVDCAPTRCACPNPVASDCCTELLPYRHEAILRSDELGDAGTAEPLPVVTTYTTDKSAVLGTFAKNCESSGCHGIEEPVGTFPNNFSAADALARINGDKLPVMPPGSGDGKLRGCTHPLLKLAHELLAYEGSGYADAFTVDLCPEEILAVGGEVPEMGCNVPPVPYALPEAKALAQTNLGQCIPTSGLQACGDDVLRTKDELFASTAKSEDLPERLSETDLVTLDSEVLAQHRVFSYSPTYTLFSDNAKKQRYVRVPQGQVIRYNQTTQDFDIPDNTRFYKTFLKPVVDKDGNVGYRKMETRLIVVRHDETLQDGRGYQFRSLRATYAWSKDEREALRVKDTKNNGEQWTTRVCPMVVNEAMTRDDTLNPIEEVVPQLCSYMTAEERAEPSSGQVRHYAIPGADACDQCHMGSNNHSYVLGFNPWQVDHRFFGDGGTYEKPHRDELNQLQRFIEYGLIEGIEPGQAKLEESQGDRKPRNDYELKAQAYMLGNCANCHTPHGYPSVENPVLKALNFFPQRGAEGGIFQFALDKESPRIRLDAAQTQPMRYITSNVTDNRFIAGDIAGLIRGWDSGPDHYQTDDTEGMFWYAPWDSAIWRNVYTPFTYPDSNAIFIHMPRNVPGFDCRAHSIMADWMLSIPSNGDAEVRPGDAAYDDALAEARSRVEGYHGSVLGQNCPMDDDILDPSVVASPQKPGDPNRKLKSAPADVGAIYGPRVLPYEQWPAEDIPSGLKDGVPDHAHWAWVDFSREPGAWAPRRGDWKAVLTGSESVKPSVEAVVNELQSVFLTPEQEKFLAQEQVPLGVWSPRCTDTAAQLGAATVSDLRAGQPSTMNRWARYFDTLPGDARVHSMTRGQAVVEAICQNCHGVNYDSKSPLAATVAELTGGESKVADFRNGLFGPPQDPGAYANAVFTFSDGNSGATPAEWQARYMLFMGFGGTKAQIPASVLSLIASSPFYGHPATTGASETGGDANMLTPAAAKCADLMTIPLVVRHSTQELPELRVGWDTSAVSMAFAQDTGHYQLWESLCNFGQAPLIRVVLPQVNPARVPGGQEYVLIGQPLTFTERRVAYYSQDRAGVATYPPDRLVGDQLGRITQGIQLDNVAPWCVDPAYDATVWFAGEGLSVEQIPYCPSELFASAFGKELYKVSLPGGATAGLEDPEARDRWYRQGGYNAGLAAYYYYDHLSKSNGLAGGFKPALNYDSPECRK